MDPRKANEFFMNQPLYLRMTARSLAAGNSRFVY